jgi:hypothetical protein
MRKPVISRLGVALLVLGFTACKSVGSSGIRSNSSIRTHRTTYGSRSPTSP